MRSGWAARLEPAGGAMNFIDLLFFLHAIDLIPDGSI
jgi:hypothetical protein